MKLKTMKLLETALKLMEEELQEKIDAIDWDKSDGETWQDKCQQRDEYFSYGFDKITEFQEIIQEMKNTTLEDF